MVRRFSAAAAAAAAPKTAGKKKEKKGKGTKTNSPEADKGAVETRGARLAKSNYAYASAEEVGPLDVTATDEDGDEQFDLATMDIFQKMLKMYSLQAAILWFQQLF